MEAAQMLFPYGKAAQAMMAAPRATASALGSMGLFGGSGALDDAEAQSRKGPAPKVDPADVSASEALPEKLRPQYLDLSARSRDRNLSRVERQQLDRLNDIVAQSAGAADKEAGKLRADQLTRAEEARMKSASSDMKPFGERFPEWNSVQGFMPAAIGALSTLPIAGRAAYGASRSVGKWNKAVDDGLKATNPGDLARSHAMAQAYNSKFPDGGISSTLKPYAVPAAIGGLEGAALSNAPEAYNMFLPSQNPEKKSLQEYLKQLPPDHPARAQAERVLGSLPDTIPERDAALHHFTSSSLPARLLTGAMEGAGGAALATTLAKPFAPSPYGYPRAGTQALSDRISGKHLGEATRAIDAEAAAMGHVLPTPPKRLEAVRHEAPQPSGGLLDLPPSPPALPPPQPAGNGMVTKRPSGGGRFDPSLYGVAAGGLLGGSEMDENMLTLYVRAGLLPASVLQAR